MNKVISNWLLPHKHKLLKKVLALLHTRKVKQESKPDGRMDIVPKTASMDELVQLCGLEANYVISTLISNEDIKSVVLIGTRIERYYITPSGVISHHRDRYGEDGMALLLKKFQFWLPILVAIVVAVIPYFLNKIDTESLQNQVERQQQQIDSLKKVLTPKPLLKQGPPYRQ